MNDLEQRFQRAATIEGYQSPNLDAIATRGHKRVHNKRIASGLASIAVLAVGAVGLVRTVDRSTAVVEAADGSLAVELGEDDGGLVSLGDEDEAATEEGGDTEVAIGEAPDGSQGEAAAGTDETDGSGDATSGTSPTTQAAAEQTQPIVDALEATFELCFGYDNASGAGTLEVWLDGENNVAVDERRVRGGAGDLAFVFRFRGDGPADGLQVNATGRFEAEGQQSTDNNRERSFVFTDDLATVASPDYIYNSIDCGAMTSIGEAPAGQTLDDGYGGSLVVDAAAGLVHQRADGSLVPIDFPSVDAVIQRWPTDVAAIDGTYYLFIDQFINVPPVQGEDVHFEVSILALNLESDELVEVERRVITNSDGREWFYNGHITTNGTQILVMRELWQSACLYAEAVTLTGAPTQAPELAGLDLPADVDALTDEVRVKLRSTAGIAELGCITLDDIDDGGIEALGRQADSAAFSDFAADFLMLYG